MWVWVFLIPFPCFFIIIILITISSFFLFVYEEMEEEDMELGGWEGEEDVRRDERGGTMVKSYCIKITFNKKNVFCYHILLHMCFIYYICYTYTECMCNGKL